MNIDQRLEEAIQESDISVDRIIWLPLLKENDDNWKFINEDILNTDAAGLKEIFGERLGGLFQNMFDAEDYESPLYELSKRGGWLVSATCRPPDPKTIRFENGKAQSWALASFAKIGVFYAPKLTTALCKALLWEHRLEQQAVRKAKNRG